MTKPTKPTRSQMEGASTPLQEQESEKLFREHLLPRYLRVIGRIGDVIVCEPRPEHFLDVHYAVDGPMVRSVRILIGPKRKKSAPSAT